MAEVDVFTAIVIATDRRRGLGWEVGLGHGDESFRVSEFQGFRVSEFQSFRVEEFQSFRVSELRDVYFILNTET